MTSTIPGRSSKASGRDDLVEMSWDPITRIVGSLGIYTKIDFKNKEVVECHSTSSIFRGYSIFMKGKDPRDAHFITSRICGICGDNHATCATYAQNMAFGIRPPAMAEWIVNLGEAAEYMFDHNIFQENLVGVDYCERMVKDTNPGGLDLANAAEPTNPKAHGSKTARSPHLMTTLMGWRRLCPSTTDSRSPSRMPVRGLSMAMCAPRAPSMDGSKKIGVKKMPNMSTTCTMYLTSRKNRFAQLRKSETPVVKRTSSRSSTT